MKTQEIYGQESLSKLLVLLLVFIGSGLALSFSISYSFSILQGRDIGIDGLQSGLQIFSLFIKQLVATIVGLIAVLYLLKTPTKTLRYFSGVFVVIAGIAMLYTAFFGPEINGSRRWLVIGGVSIQTGDFARLAMILYLSDIFAQFNKYKQMFKEEQVPPAIIKKLVIRFFIAVFIYLGGLYVQSDYSSLLISMGVICALVFVSDVNSKWKLSGVVVALMLLLLIVISNPNRLGRIIDYFNPGSDPLGTEFQISQSYNIIGNGGLLGGGIGSNMLDVLSLPYFNNDFVFSIIVGEYGLLGAIVLFMLFWVLCWYAYKLGTRIFHKNKFYYYLILAGTVNIVISAVFHIAVTIGLLPTAGLNLPFYSSGGSAMVTAILSYGFILRASIALSYYEKNTVQEEQEIISVTQAIEDNGKEV